MENRLRTVAGVVVNPSFWQNKRVLLTGHTGFKGAWLALWLQQLGASVSGYALPPASEPSAYEIFGLGDVMNSQFADVRDQELLARAIERTDPEIVFHLASQAIVRDSLRHPATTFQTNLLGLVNLIEGLRHSDRPIALVNVTSDKVYDNRGNGDAFVETDRLGGADPYSASKACAEIITHAYRATVLQGGKLRVSSARAGNVIGGGDWAPDRIVPDIVRAVAAAQTVTLRYPGATRPWQHVVEPLSGYLELAERMVTEGPMVDGAYNFGPGEGTLKVSVAELTEQLLAAFGSAHSWRKTDVTQPPEMQQLRIDSTKARTVLGWSTKLTVSEAVQWTVAWYKAWFQSEDMRQFSIGQLKTYQRNFCGV